MQDSPKADWKFELTGDIPPRNASPAYVGALGLSAVAMLLLPVIYVGLIVAVGFGVGYYAVHAVSVLEASGSLQGRVLVYFGPLVIGIVVVAFMLKPLFARRPPPASLLGIDLEAEPQLQSLIHGLCKKVGAPVPDRVEVDCNVNAAAARRQGLVLVIGLPLVGGLSARQLAGVLAHEFGHFSQGAGMGFSRLIYRINHWFHRVVFERDNFDLTLDRWIEEADRRIALVLRAAKWAVWLSRKILHGLMYVGHAVSCLQSRQMEFDADYYEAQVAGSAAFAETSRELRCLAAARQAAFRTLNEHWQEQRLVDDLPELISLHRRVQPLVQPQDERPKARWFHTHPDDESRIAHAARLGCAGIFQGDFPAAGLFRDFSALCQAATSHYYRQMLGLNFEETNLLASETAMCITSEKNLARAALDRLTETILNLTRPVVWDASDFVPSVSPAEVGGGLAAQRTVMVAELGRAQAAEKAYQDAEIKHRNAEIALLSLTTGLPTDAAAFGLRSATIEDATRQRDAMLAQMQESIAALSQFETAVHRWVALVGQTASMAGGPLPAHLGPRLDAAATTLAGIGPWLRRFPASRRVQRLVALFRAPEQAMADNQNYLDDLAGLRAEGRKFVEEAPELVPSVFAFQRPAGVRITLAQLLERELTGVNADDRLDILVRLTVAQYFDLLGEIAAIGEDLERALTPVPPSGI